MKKIQPKRPSNAFEWPSFAPMLRWRMIWHGEYEYFINEKSIAVQKIFPNEHENREAILRRLRELYPDIHHTTLETLWSKRREIHGEPEASL